MTALKGKKKAPASPPAKTKTPKTKRKKLLPARDEVGERIRAVLMEIMCSSDSDSVRVAAAKALMDKLRKSEEVQDDDARQREENERAEALAEARAFLDAVADAKSGGADRAGAVD